MFRNYWKTAFRQIIRHKSFSAINILGLAVGLAACLLLFMVVRYEMSYDRFLPGYERIYAIPTQDKSADDVSYTSGIPEPALHALRLEFPQVTIGSLISSYGSQVTVLNESEGTGSNEKYIESTGLFFADPEWFEVFPYTWVSGGPETLKQPGQVALTKKLASKYFGDWKNAMGKRLLLDNAMDLQVSGILEDVPANSDIPLALVASMETARSHPEIFNYFDQKGTTTSNYRLFARLPAGTRVAAINEQLSAFSKKFYPVNRGSQRSNFLVPLTELHFDTRLDALGDHIISRSTLKTLSLVGIFILIMACINFINLSTSQAINRSKEIGVRKVLGGSRKDLFWQMMGETALIVLFSLLLAFGLAYLCQPLIKHITLITEPLELISSETLLMAAGLWVVVTFVSGFYPSLVLSGFKPMLALKNKLSSAQVGGISLRRGLVISQFAISQVLIIGTIVAVTQMDFVRKADLGFNKEAVLVLSTNSDSSVYARQEAVKQEWLKIPEVQSVSFGSDVPSSDNNWSTNFAFDHREDEKYHVFLKFGDEDYFQTFGLELIAGKGYRPSDTAREVVINETLMKKLGHQDPNAVVGKEIRTGRGPWLPIVGVVRDFKTNSLREETKPILISTLRNFYYSSSLKLKSDNLAATREKIEDIWNRYNPNHAAIVNFLDESIENFYRQENQLSLLYKVFAVIALFISCLGLYGLVSFMAVQRRREVGIRKVLGASVSHILFLFSKEFTILVLLAFVIAAPLAWYMMSEWLSNFAYRIEMGIGIFALAIFASVIVAWITVGYKSFRAATSSPVRSIREF
jgi:predicted permease